MTIPFRWKPIASALAAGAWLWLGGCALQSDVRILEDRLIALERKSADLQEALAETRRARTELEGRLRQYGSLIEEKDVSLRNQSAGLQVTADQIRSEIQALNGRMEETAFRLRQRVSALEGTVRAGSQAPGPSPEGTDGVRPATGPGPSVGAAAAPAPPAGASADVLYATGKRAFDARDYAEAAQYFQGLLQRYPDAPQADNAQFWLGEILYQQRDFEQAILAYQQVIESYPTGNKVAASLLKQGFAFSSLGDRDNARLILQDLMDRFPHTSEARIAEQKLENL